MQNISNARIMLVTLGLLIIPLAGNFLSEGMVWDITDFVVAWVLLTLTGLALKFATARVINTKRRVLVAVLILLIFLFIWAELAVGIVGSPFAGS